MEPTVRFPEFKGSWNNYKIEDMFDRVGTLVDLDDTQTYREIGIRSHGKGIFHKEETTATEIGNKRVFWVEPDCFVVNIVFAWERAVAKTTEKENGMIASHRFPMYKPKKDVVDLDYITEYFITKRGQNVLILASPGGAGRNKTLGQKEFAKSIVKLPSLPEQQKIAEFLSTIDTVIEKQKETVSAWEERKKGVMQKLFSQEVRFKADDGSEFPEWEEKILDEEGFFYGGLTGKNKDDFEKGNSKFITYMNVYKNTFANQDMMGTVNVGITEKQNKVLYGDILFTQSSETVEEVGLSSVYLYDDEPYLNSFCMGFRFNDLSNVCPKYMGYCMRSENIRKNIMLMGQGISRINLGAKRLKTVSYKIPCLAEQQKIADCLSSLDDVIEKQKATLVAWEEMKKGLLQQMFV